MAAKQSLFIVSIVLLALVVSAQDVSSICHFVGTCNYSDECPKVCQGLGFDRDSLCLPNPKAGPNSPQACCCVKPGAGLPPM